MWADFNNSFTYGFVDKLRNTVTLTFIAEKNHHIWKKQQSFMSSICYKFSPANFNFETSAGRPASLVSVVFVVLEECSETVS